MNYMIFLLAECREISAIHKGLRIQTAWSKALKELRKNKKKITLVKSGPNKGTVKGLPLNLNLQVAQVLMKVVMEEEPVLLDEELVHPPIEMMNVFKRRKWGDSITSLLAAMYISLKRFPTTMSKSQICAIARRYCNHAIEDDYRNRRRGAWSSMKHDLVEKYNFVESRRTGPTYYSPVEFNLTRRGIEFCSALFTRKFHPTRGTCPVAITSPYATVREDGTVIPLRDRRPEEHDGYGDGNFGNPEARNRCPGIADYDEHVHDEGGFGDWGYNFGEPKINHDHFNPQSDSGYDDRVFGNDLQEIEPTTYIGDEDMEMMRAIRVSRFEQLQQLNKKGKNYISQIKTETPSKSKVEQVVSKVSQPLQKDLRVLEDEQLSLAIAMSLESNATQSDSVIDICSQQSTHEPETINICSQPSPEIKQKKRRRDFETPVKLSVTNHSSTPVISLLDDIEDVSSGSTNKRARHKTNQVPLPQNDCPKDDFENEYFDLSEIELDCESMHHGSFHVTTDPISGSVLDLTCSPTHSDCDDDARSISSDESPSFSPHHCSVENNPSKRLSSASQSTISLWKRASIEIDLTESFPRSNPREVNSPNLIPDQDLVCTIFVDRRERKDQANYRMFFLGIERHIKSFFPEHYPVEQSLLVGDFLLLKSANRSGLSDQNKKNSQAVFNHVIERKTISDIISRSLGEKRKHWAFEGAHVRQLRYMQYCGIESSFILLEGSITGLAAAQAPLVRYTGQSGPDMITSSFDIMVFVTNMIACGWGKYRTHILQSNDEVKTAHLIAALSYLFMNHSHRSPPSLPYSSINWQIKKEELSFYMALMSLDLDREFVARIVRKFSTQQALKEAYDIALRKSEAHASALLTDIQPNVSLSGRQTILTPENGEYDDDSEDETYLNGHTDPEKGILLHEQSEKVFHFITGSSMRKSTASHEHSERKTFLVMNPSMKSILSLPNAEGQVPAFGDFIEIQVNEECSGNLPIQSPLEILDVSWVTATVRTSYPKLIRQSAPTHICVLSGDILMESLIRAERMLENTRPVTSSSSNLDLFHHFYEVIDFAVINYLQPLIPNMSFNTQSAQANPSIQILIFDNFGPMTSNSGAFHRLQNELNKLQHESRFSSSSSTFSLRKGRFPLSTSAGQIIQLHFLKIIYPLLICYLNVCQRCYVIESRNSKDCEKWLSFLFTSIHLHSLLFY